MAITLKQARAKIKEGSLETIARWKVPEENLKVLLDDIDMRLKKSFFRRVITIPVIIWLIGLYAIFGSDNPKVGSYTLIVGIGVLGVSYAWARMKPGFLKKKYRQGNEAFFGDNWLLYGNVFLRWEALSDTTFKKAYLENFNGFDQLQVDVENAGKGGGKFSHIIPVPKQELTKAQDVITAWTSK